MTDPTRPDSPRIYVPPPFLFVGVALLAFVAERTWHWPFPGPGPIADLLREVAGVALLGAGLLLDLVALLLFWRSRTSALPFRPAAAMVSGGPYRFTRNPMYLGLTLTTVGLGALLDVVWLAFAGVVAAVLVDRFVIPREERYLERRFGAEYHELKRRVRRWL